MPSWRNIPSMPKVRDSSGTIGTTNLPSALSRSRILRMRTNAIVVEISRSSVAWRQEAAELLTALAQVLHLGTVVGEREERDLLELLVRHRNGETIAEFAQRLEPHLLLLVGDVLAFAGLTHAVALDGLGENHSRLAGMLHGCCIGGVDLDRVVTAATKHPDIVVAQILHERSSLRVLAEELLAHIGTVLGLEVLIFTVDAFFHALAQQARFVFGEQRIPAGAPTHLDDIPAGAAEDSFELLHDLTVTAYRAVETLEVAVDNKDQIVESLAAAERDRAERFRLVHLAVPHESPHLAPLGVS